MENKDFLVHNLKEINEYLEKLTLKIGGKALLEKLKKEITENNRINLKIYIDQDFDNSEIFLGQVKKILPRVQAQKIVVKDNLDEIMRLGAKVLPFFLFDQTIKNDPSFSNLMQKKMIISHDGKNFFIPENFFSEDRVILSRKKEPGQLILFTSAGKKTAEKAKEIFNQHKIKFSEHDGKSALGKELKVKNTPSFLIDNVYFFEFFDNLRFTRHKNIFKKES